MCDREFLVDRYDLAVVKDELDCQIRKMYNNDICPIKSSLQLKKHQIEGLADVVIMLGDEIDKINKQNTETKLNKLIDELNERFNTLNYILITSLSLSIFSIVCFLSS